MFDVVNGDEVRLSTNKDQSPSVSRVAAASPHVVPGIETNTQHSSSTLGTWCSGENNSKHISWSLVQIETQTHAGKSTSYLPRTKKPYTSTQILGAFKLPRSTGQSPYGASEKYILNRLSGWLAMA